MMAVESRNRMQTMLALLFVWMALVAPGTQADIVSKCMTFRQIAEDINLYSNLNSNSLRHDCSSLNACNGVTCTVDVLGIGLELYPVTIWPLPCVNPPSLRIVLQDPDGEVVFSEIVGESFTVEYAELLLNVTVERNVDLELMQLKMVFVDSEVFNPEEGLDPVFIPTTAFDISPTMQCDISTCQVIESAIFTTSNSNLTVGSDLECRLTPRCDGLSCQIRPQMFNVLVTASAKIVACNNPPAIQIVIENPLGGPDILNQLYTQTTTTTISNDLIMGIVVMVTVDQFENGLGVEATMTVPLTEEGVLEEKILEYRYFPVNREEADCSFYSPTCLALEGVVDRADRSNVTCNTTKQCGGVVCLLEALGNGVLFPATADLVPCNKPTPAVDLRILDPTDASKVVFESRVESTDTLKFFDYDIEVLVEELSTNTTVAIGFEVNVVSTNPEMPTDTIMIPYTVIPVNTSTCVDAGGVPLNASLASVVMATIGVMLAYFL